MHFYVLNSKKTWIFDQLEHAQSFINVKMLLNVIILLKLCIFWLFKCRMPLRDFGQIQTLTVMKSFCGISFWIKVTLTRKMIGTVHVNIVNNIIYENFLYCSILYVFVFLNVLLVELRRFYHSICLSLQKGVWKKCFQNCVL